MGNVGDFWGRVFVVNDMVLVLVFGGGWGVDVLV